MTIREILNSILDEDIGALSMLILNVILLIAWTGFIGSFFWELVGKTNRWLEKKAPFEIKDDDSYLRSLALFFPVLFFMLLPSGIILMIGLAIWMIPLMWLLDGFAL